MFYKFYLACSAALLLLFTVAQYQGWSLFSEDNSSAQHGHTHSSGGSYSSGSHRGGFHK
jgi:hypothetical protein